MKSESSGRLRLAPAARQIVGSRERQEDAWRIEWKDDCLIVLVADGLGGHDRGDEASRVAVRTTGDWISAFCTVPGAEPGAVLRQALIEAHRSMFRIERKRSSKYPPASTLVGGWITASGRAHLANVGDSLGFLLREQELQQLFLPQRIGARVAYCLGCDIGDDDDGTAICVLEGGAPLQPNDRLILATDGILTLSERSLIDLVAMAATPEAAVASVMNAITEAAEHDQDNATIAVVFVECAD